MTTSRTISFLQVVTEADPTYWLDRRKPRKYKFSNGRIFYSPGDDNSLYIAAAQYFDTILGIPLWIATAGGYVDFTGATVTAVDPEPTTTYWDAGSGFPTWSTTAGMVNASGVLQSIGPFYLCPFIGLGTKAANGFADIYSVILNTQANPIIPLWYQGSGSWVNATGTPQ